MHSTVNHSVNSAVEIVCGAQGTGTVLKVGRVAISGSLIGNLTHNLTPVPKKPPSAAFRLSLPNKPSEQNHACQKIVRSNTQGFDVEAAQANPKAFLDELLSNANTQ